MRDVIDREHLIPGQQPSSFSSPPIIHIVSFQALNFYISSIRPSTVFNPEGCCATLLRPVLGIAKQYKVRIGRLDEEMKGTVSMDGLHWIFSYFEEQRIPEQELGVSSWIHPRIRQQRWFIVPRFHFFSLSHCRIVDEYQEITRPQFNGFIFRFFFFSRFVSCDVGSFSYGRHSFIIPGARRGSFCTISGLTSSDRLTGSPARSKSWRTQHIAAFVFELYGHVNQLK